MTSNEGVSKYYDEKYFSWQKNAGAFGGKANCFKFKNSVKPTDIVIDFGCGGGFLIANLECSTRIGIEPNHSAIDTLEGLGVLHFYSSKECLDELGSEVADVIISNNALEHTLNPLEEIKSLLPLLKKDGIIHFVVPCDSINYSYDQKDINYHLFSWSPQNLGNIFTEAGYEVEFSRPYIHKWPPFYRHISKLGWPLFNLIARVYGRIERSWFQVEIKAKRPKMTNSCTSKTRR